MMTLKKTVVNLTMILLVIGLLAGCAGGPAVSTAPSDSTAPSENTAAGESASSDTSEQAPPKKIIGVIIQNTDDAVMSAVKRLLDSAADALNVELIYKTGDLDGESQISAVENVIAAGAEGIMVWPLAGAIIPRLLQICSDAEVAYVQMFESIDDPDIAAQAKANPYYLGYATEDQINPCRTLTKLLADNGNKNICIIRTPPGENGDIRYDTIVDAMEEEGLNLTSEYIINYTSRPQTQAVDAVNNFLATYPEMDGVFLLCGIIGLLDGVKSVVESEDVLGKVNVVSFDHPATGTGEMFEKGAFIGLASGGYVDPLFSFIILYNYLQGTPLSDEPIEVNLNYVIVKNYDNAVAFEKYYNPDFLVYTQEEIKMMTKFYNPDFTLEDLQKIVADYSIEGVISRFE